MALLVSDAPPCLLFEDEHLLVVNKPPGISTHSASPYGSEGIYDWLRHREPRWASLAIMHRLDKDTSGVLAFAKTPVANQALTAEFTGRAVQKKYVLLANRWNHPEEITVESSLVRSGERYASSRVAGLPATTRFRLLERRAEGIVLIEAQPVTGRTHQIRVHAAEQGFPIKGDRLYGGQKAARLCLHAAELRLTHPAARTPMAFSAQPDFELDPETALREGLIDGQTNAFRLVHGDGRGWYLDRLGSFLLSTADRQASETDQAAERLRFWIARYGITGVYGKPFTKRPGPTVSSQDSPELLSGSQAPEEFEILENGLRFAVSFREGPSVGLFLDQRDNRRRVLVKHIAAGFPLLEQDAGFEVLNTFAYTCGFSVCAAKAGARTTSLDLSKKYLAWGQRNFQLNQLDPARHEFMSGDVFDWCRRLVKKKRLFDLILLDPPTFSRSKESGTFNAEKDYGRLVGAVLPLLKSRGVLFASTNAATVKPEDFLGTLQHTLRSQERTVSEQQYFPQPIDFPISRAEPGYLKTCWFRVI